MYRKMVNHLYRWLTIFAFENQIYSLPARYSMWHPYSHCSYAICQRLNNLKISFGHISHHFILFFFVKQAFRLFFDFYNCK